jgi:hypothetical protein
MRMATIVASTNLVIALAVISSAFAQTERIKPGSGAAGGAVLHEGATPAKKGRPTGAQQSGGPTTSINSELSKGECTKLGGTIKTSDICNSGSYCSTTDQNGKAHRVCINKLAE